MDELADTAKDAKPERLRQVFEKVVDSVELTFKTEIVRTKAGGERKRHTLIEGVVNETSLLSVAQQAGCFGQILLGRGASDRSNRLTFTGEELAVA